VRKKEPGQAGDTKKKKGTPPRLKHAPDACHKPSKCRV